MKDLDNRIRRQRTVILGIGNSLHGDEGIGPALIDLLQGRVGATLIDAKDVPENYLNQIEAAHPELVLIINSIDMGIEPGCVVVFEVNQIGGWSKLTHNYALRWLSTAIYDRTGADVVLVGVQPASKQFGEGLSAPVVQTLNNLGDWFQRTENQEIRGDRNIPTK